MLLALVAVLAPLCRYTVRDIGFVDLVGPEYALVHGAPKDAPLSAAGRELLAALARDGNVSPGEGEMEGGWWLTRDGLAPLRLDVQGSDEAAARGAWEAAVRSPARDRVLAEALTSFATVLRVRGADPEVEARVDEVLAAATAGLETLSATLPRAIDRPLRLVEVSRDDEAVLLWSMGLDAEPRAAVALVYGRGKLAAPAMVGEAITLTETLAQLALVGDSCECDTPRDWFGQPRLPMAWTDRQRARAASELGFDPESPMVKSEVVRILERGPLEGGAPREVAAGGAEGLLLGYREVELGAGGAPPAERGFEPDGGAPSTDTVRVVEATEGDDWGFEDEGSEDAGPEDTVTGEVGVAPPVLEPAATGSARGAHSPGAKQAMGEEPGERSMPGSWLLFFGVLLGMVLLGLVVVLAGGVREGRGGA